MLYGTNHLKAYIIEYYIFPDQKNNRYEGQNMGGIKDMLSPTCQNMGRGTSPHPPRDLRPCMQVFFYELKWTFLKLRKVDLFLA